LSGITETFINFMISLLDFFRSATGSYGLAIVIFGSLVKLVLYPLTQKQYESMKEMQKIQPMMKKIQEKYKSDPQRMQTEQMALYKKYNINPLGGCLPLLIQMPILIGIFMTIRRMSELGRFANESFLWIGSPLAGAYEWIGDSLASPDIPLLLIYGVSMYLSQKMTVSDPSNAQTQKMMSIMMPVIFVFVLWSLPSSLILYWLVFNILSIVQQYFIMKKKDDTSSNEANDNDTDIDMEESVEAELQMSPSGRVRSRSRKKKGGKIK
jgi:YidC/Oxa1 family membrane protein insertase